jgi:hypothetical protein
MMRFSKRRFVAASFVGAIAIHVVLVACGTSDLGRSAGSNALDAIASLVDSESREARAADPECCQSAFKPPASENPQQWLMGKAEVALASANLPVRAKLADGPLFLERASSQDSTGVVELYVSDAAGCETAEVSLGQVGWVNQVSNQVSYRLAQSTPSGRGFVPAGKVLCARAAAQVTTTFPLSVTVSWQGFKPY